MRSLVKYMRVWIRCFTHPTPADSSHAFVVGATVGGLSERLASFLIHDEITTFRDLRQMIEVFNDNGMNRRTPIFQDLIYTMETSANPHDYSRNDRLHYRFGFIEGVGGQELGETNIVRDYDKTLTPHLISEDLEGEPIREIINDLLEHDILLVPVSQIRPKDGQVTMQPWIETIETEEEKRKRELEMINSIDLSKYSPEKIIEANTRLEEESAMERSEG